MPPSPDDPAPASAPDDDENVEVFEALLAEAIEAHATGGLEGVQQLCDAHPEQAERLRARLASLQRLGLLVEEHEAGGPKAFGPYIVQRRIGQGGMSVVYLARDERLGRRVALKACHALLESDPRARRRFEQEIAAVARLEHPGIVRIFDMGEAEGRLYFTMEYVEGATLAELVAALKLRGERGDALTGERVRAVLLDLVAQASEDGQPPTATPDDPWPRTWVETLCRWMLDVANALGHAHRAGIVHRDVKASNIIVGLDGRARLFDLGLAHIADQPALTHSGDFTGTPYSMSPEQLVGKRGDIDQRTDVFSLGVTLYELLTRERPFDGRNTAQVFKQITDRDPTPPRRHDPSVPADLETICLTALEKSPGARYQSMAEFAADLQRLLEFTPVQARPLSPSRRAVRFIRRNPARATALGLALAVAIGVPTGSFLAHNAVSRERDRATRQAELNARVTDFLVELFQLTPSELERAETVTAREILDRGAARIPTGFEDQPLVRAALMRANGKVYLNLGLTERALPLLDRALAVYERELGEGHSDTADLLHELGQAHLLSERADLAAGLCERSLEAYALIEERPGLAALRCQLTLADARRGLHEDDAARREVEGALASSMALPDTQRAALRADAYELLGQLHLDAAQFAPARDALLASWDLRRALWVPEPVAMRRTLQALADAHAGLGEETQAAARREQAQALGDALASVPETDVLAAPQTGPFALLDPRHEEYEIAFQDGISALQAKDFDASREAFERCLELVPRHPICAYNITCGQALAGETEAAFEWLERTLEFGFAYVLDGPPTMEQDPNLATLRGHRRWKQAFESMGEQLREVQRYVSEPGVYRPDTLRAGERAPLLVVLHADGATRDSVLSGPWREVADELGMQLLAPSASTPTSARPRDGMRWFRELGDFVRRPWTYEAPVIAAITAQLERSDIDHTEVLIAGEGSGALLAADLALTAPGLFGGVLAVNGPVLPELAWRRTRVASSVGLPVHVLLHGEDVLGRPEGLSLPRFADDVRDWFGPWGLAAHGHVTLAADEASPARARGDALHALRELAARRP